MKLLDFVHFVIIFDAILHLRILCIQWCILRIGKILLSVLSSLIRIGAMRIHDTIQVSWCKTFRMFFSFIRNIEFGLYSEYASLPYIFFYQHSKRKHAIFNQKQCFAYHNIKTHDQQFLGITEKFLEMYFLSQAYFK